MWKWSPQPGSPSSLPPLDVSLPAIGEEELMRQEWQDAVAADDSQRAIPPPPKKKKSSSKRKREPKELSSLHPAVTLRRHKRVRLTKSHLNEMRNRFQEVMDLIDPPCPKCLRRPSDCQPSSDSV
jgi:hypothetical protein